MLCLAAILTHRCLPRAACSLPLAIPPLLLSPSRCINVLLELIQTKVNYVVQESIIVIKDIFR